MITLDDQAELESAKILAKKPNRVTLSQDYGLVNRHLLAKLLDAEGVFDFQFTQTNKDNSLITIAYTDLVKEKGKLTRDVVLKFVNFSAGESKPTKDQISFKSKASAISINAAKPGFVLVSEYFRKAKTIEIHLEPINF